MRSLIGGFVLATAAVLSAQDKPAPAQAAQPPQTFKSSVDLVPVDVNVVDRDGRPIADLTAEDFSLKVDGKSRRIASAQFVAVSRNVEREPVNPDYSANPKSAGARLVMLVVDQGNIGASRGKYAIDAARRFIGRLSPDDRVGLVTIPGAGPQIDFTANHALVQTALQKVVGTSDDGEHQDNQIGLTEAIALQRGNRQVLTQILERECTGLAAGVLADCRTTLEAQARSVYLSSQSRTRDTLLSLRQVMDRLARTTTPKTVVLLSEGVLIDSRDLHEISWLGPTASKGQVTLYVLQLEPPAFNASNVQSSPTRAADIEFAHDGLGFLAGAAGGSVFKVISGAENAFSRLALELSGYYLLSFEPEPGDRDTKSHKIKIEVPRRKELFVRARSDFSVDAPRTRTTEEQLADAITAPLPASDIGLKLAAYSFTENEGSRLRIILAAEIDRSQNRDNKIALAYTVVDDHDQLVSSQVEPAVTTEIRPDTQMQTYFGAITASPGTYRVKLAVVDDTGRTGSVEHTVRARLTSAGQIHLTDLLLGDDSTGSGLRPVVTAEFKGDMLHGYVELHSEAQEPLRDASVTFEIANNPQARAIDTVPGRFETEATPSPTRRIAEAAVPIALLPPGEYTARAVVTVAGQKLGQVTRNFHIVRDANAATTRVPSAPVLTTKIPIPFTSRIESFERASVLTPQVVGFFVDRMNIGRNTALTPPPAVAAARAGKFEEAIEAAKVPGANQLAPVFFDGLAKYARGELGSAASRFSEALKLQSDYFPAAFYLGACYAAQGNDKNAAGAWQMSLITESEAPFIYTLLGDAFIRLREFDAALDILREASSLWPGNDQVQLRLGTAYAVSAQPVEAVKALDPYLARHPEDQERLLIALRSIYDARSKGQSIETVEEDRKRFERYAAAYAATGGPQMQQVEQWRRLLSR